jgi:hypothetical protein
MGIMDKNSKWVNKILGEGFFEELQKTEMFKPQTRTNLDTEEIAIAYKIVPKLVLNFLIENLKPMAIGHNKTISLLPIGINGDLLVNKLSKDVYSGDINSEGKRVYDYQYRSIPGIGIILLSTFEMYDLQLEAPKNEIAEIKPEINHFSYVDEAIEERIRLNKLISEVIDKKVSEKEAVERLVNNKLAEIFLKVADVVEEREIIEEKVEEKVEKPSIKDFLNRKTKQHSLEFLKSDISCTDCGVNLYKNENDFITGCICYGFGPEDKKATVKICKSEDKISLKFNKSWGNDEIEKLLKTVKKG